MLADSSAWPALIVAPWVAPNLLCPSMTSFETDSSAVSHDFSFE